MTRDAVILHAQQRQGARNVTMRNVVTSMRLISEMDWQDFFEEVSPVDAQLRGASNFAALDFSTRNLYRTAIEMLARGSGKPEAEVAGAALALGAGGEREANRDPGHWLIGPGRGPGTPRGCARMAGSTHTLPCGRSSRTPG